MKLSVIVALVVVSTAGIASAQTANSQPLVGGQVLTAPASDSASNAAAVPDLVGQALAPPSTTKLFDPGQPSVFRTVGGDLKGFFSSDTGKVVALFAVAGLSAMPLDKPVAGNASEWMSTGATQVGKWGGSAYVLAGSGFATYMIGRTTGHSAVTSLGADLIRAQLLSQIFVQGTKFAVGRQRPDHGNSLSFPSGHSASAFATATVLQQHLGWKVGVPAFAYAGFVGASRMASSRHYLTDVMIGAGVGIAAGRTVTLHLGREKFSLGAAPTRGGAMVTFTKN